MTRALVHTAMRHPVGVGGLSQVYLKWTLVVVKEAPDAV